MLTGFLILCYNNIRKREEGENEWEDLKGILIQCTQT